MELNYRQQIVADEVMKVINLPLSRISVKEIKSGFNKKYGKIPVTSLLPTWEAVCKHVNVIPTSRKGLLVFQLFQLTIDYAQKALV